MFTTFRLVALFAAANWANAGDDRPSLIVNNYCEFDVYLWTIVSGGYQDHHPHQIKSLDRWSKPVYYSRDGNPVVKLAVNPSLVNTHGKRKKNTKSKTV
jgi:hypothetical protein